MSYRKQRQSTAMLLAAPQCPTAIHVQKYLQEHKLSAVLQLQPVVGGGAAAPTAAVAALVASHGHDVQGAC
jgi:hypothetical protein